MLNNKKIIVPVNAGVGFENIVVSEKWMMKVLEILSLPDDSVVVDVGVNVGQTLIKLKAVSPNIEYLGFEPNPLCVQYVAELITANNWEHVSVVPVGIAENSGVVMLQFFSADKTDSCASIVPGFRDESTVTKKDFCACFNATELSAIFLGKKIALIKIDVEGAEFEVINNFKSKIKECRPYLLVEILPVYDSKNTKRLEQQLLIEEILSEFSYYKYRIHKDENNNLLKFALVEDIGVHDRLDWCDYLFSPNAIEL